MNFFSVIMPTYNQAHFIRRAILSLYEQTYPNWELIIINDGCTDETEMFISDFLDDARVVYIKNENNQGLGYALNQGLKVAKFDLIAYLPSDDYYFENHPGNDRSAF
ncbi:glycosyltransferase family 2 protein [Bacteroides sp. BFG-551]|nr:glycosyltransferase family 2 protein [Bacteroides sp. BFG-551]